MHTLTPFLFTPALLMPTGGHGAAERLRATHVRAGPAAATTAAPAPLLMRIHVACNYMHAAACKVVGGCKQLQLCRFKTRYTSDSPAFCTSPSLSILIQT